MELKEQHLVIVSTKKLEDGVQVKPDRTAIHRQHLWNEMEERKKRESKEGGKKMT